jgi:hypothetical protein
MIGGLQAPRDLMIAPIGDSAGASWLVGLAAHANNCRGFSQLAILGSRSVCRVVCGPALSYFVPHDSRRDRILAPGESGGHPRLKKKKKKKKRMMMNMKKENGKRQRCKDAYEHTSHDLPACYLP